MSHYYTNDENLKHQDFSFDYTYYGKRLSFESDAGVFSKKNVDFGTHLLIQSISDLDNKHSLLDIGCGIGVIGIALKSRYEQLDVTMSDVNLRAIEKAKTNAYKNGVKAKIIESNMYDKIFDSFDVIVSNPPIRAGKEVVYGIVDGGYKRLKPKGLMYFVIQKKQGAPSFLKHLEVIFSKVETVNKEKGYYIFKCYK